MFVASKEYGRDFLEPVLSGDTHDYHFGKHHVTYVNNINSFVENNPSLSGKSLEEIIKSKHNIDHKIYNNAAQAWNHDFYWKSLAPYKTSIPSAAMTNMINRDFGSVDEFQEEYKKQALSVFGSGWSWFVYNKDARKLQILNTQNADNYLVFGHIVHLLTIDVWEHAYYIDYRNDRGKYLDSIILSCLNWQFAEHNLDVNCL